MWVVYHQKHTGTPSLTWSEAVSEALCVRWIDSQAEPIDGDTCRQLFSRRKPRSGWSRVNKEKIQQLAADGLLMPAWPPSQQRSKTAPGRCSTRLMPWWCRPTWRQPC